MLVILIIFKPWHNGHRHITTNGHCFVNFNFPLRDLPHLVSPLGLGILYMICMSMIMSHLGETLKSPQYDDKKGDRMIRYAYRSSQEVEKMP